MCKSIHILDVYFNIKANKYKYKYKYNNNILFII